MNKKLTLFATVLLATSSVFACTNFLVTKGATKDGSSMITYAADSHTLYGELYYRPAATYSDEAMMDIYEWDTGKFLGKIKQVKQTYSVVGNMNEYQLAIGETTYGGRHELEDTTGIMDYGSLIYIALQRAKTCREAIRVIADLMAEYGYCSSGESFSLSDGNEVWIMELIGKGVKIKDKKGNIDPKQNTKGAVWVALRIPDGYICGHANQARIRTFKLDDGKTSIAYTKKNMAKLNNPDVEVIYSADVISYARNIGIYNGKDADFSFRDTYCPLNFGGARGCEARVWAGFMKANPSAVKEYEDYARGDNLEHVMPLWIKPDHKLTLNDVMSFMRDHYEGTSMDMTQDVGAGPFKCPYRWRPMGWEYNGKKYLHERAAATQQTGFSFIAQSRPWLPTQLGGILWFGVDDTYSTCYTPMFCGITEIPINFRVGNGNLLTYSSTSAFWLFNRVSQFLYSRYCDMIKDVQKVQSEQENKYQRDVEDLDKAYMVLYKENPVKARQMLNIASNKAAKETFDAWKKLDEFLLVKYIDGNIKLEENGKFKDNGIDPSQPAWPLQPEYPQWFYKAIVDDAGDNVLSK